MFDIWSFLLQTLTVSGVAALILVIKALFKDKLSPKWQFAVWSVLGIIMLLPAGMFGRYTLFRWQLIVELVKSWFGVYSFTKVLFPIPIIRSVPQTIAEWIFVVYVLGILVFIVKYLVSYFKLRRVLKLGDVPNDEKLARIFEIASEQGIKVGKVIEVSGLPSAFVCGVFRPILVIPAENELNEKIVLHELFHLKNKDTLWSVIFLLALNISVREHSTDAPVSPSIVKLQAHLRDGLPLGRIPTQRFIGVCKPNPKGLGSNSQPLNI